MYARRSGARFGCSKLRGLCAAVVIALCACSGDAGAGAIPEFRPCEQSALGAGLIRVEDGVFVQDGDAFVPQGVNSYPLLQLAGEQRWDAVRDVFDQALALGRPFVRTNAFMDGGDHPARLRDDDGSIREPGLVALDRVVAEAASFGVRLLLVLTNNWPDYGGAEAVLRAVAPGEALPKDAFWSDPRAIDAQAGFIQTLVSRTNSVTGVAYAEDPTIFAWELANEPRCTDRRLCARDTLVRWAEVMADEVRRAGALQPIAWGGSGYVGKEGEDLAAIAADGAVDILTLHVYAQLPSDWLPQLGPRARIDAASLLGASALYNGAALARHYAMPLIVEELGYRPPDDATDRDAERAAVMRALLSTAHDQGLATFPWMIGETGRPDYDGYLVRPEDGETRAVLQCIATPAERS